MCVFVCMYVCVGVGVGVCACVYLEITMGDTNAVKVLHGVQHLYAHMHNKHRQTDSRSDTYAK
jgi:hypothetical protein